MGAVPAELRGRRCQSEVSKVELSLKRETKLVVGQRMYQSMNFLQMGLAELDTCLRELSMENPMLESHPPAHDLGRGIMRPCSGRARTRNGENAELPIPERAKRTLRSALEEQLLSMHLTRELERAVRFLIINLDERGYLSPDVGQAARNSGLSSLFEEALAVLQGMEPAGVGARDLSECLRIQLTRLGLGGGLAEEICRSMLEHLAKNHIHHISKALNASEQEVMEAKKLISSLEPTPSNGFDSGECTLWVIPDIEVRFEDGKPQLLYMDGYMPSYGLSSYYASMLEQPELSEEERDYLREKLSQAQWALGCVKRRRDTLLSCAAAIVEEQREFFENGTGTLRPCSMTEVAARVGVHPSTVSRAVKDKYISCRWGVFPMSRFFAKEVCGETQDDIMQVMLSIISAEDPRRPLSDSAICQQLSARGYDIARRTVAKYRDLANIPPATGRKQRCSAEA